MGNNERIKYADSYYNIQHKYDELYKLSKENKPIKNLMEIILNEDNIKLAYRNIKSNTGSKTKGVDNKTIKDINKFSTEYLVKHIKNRLVNFNPNEVRRVMIPKDNGKERPLGIPTIMDRIIQQSIKQVLEPICEAKFHDHSYGFRPNRDTSHALFRIQHLINNSQLHYCVDVDIKSFFDEVDHGKLLKQLWTIGIKDKRVLKIISKMLKCKVDGKIQEKGVPQGGILSPLLANVVLNELDWWISNQYETKKLRDDDKYSYCWHFREKKNRTNLKEIYIVRYADDFKIMCRDYVSSVKILEATKSWLKERLKLEVSSEKTKIINSRKNYSDFLGIKIKAKLGKNNKYYSTSRIGNKRVIKIKKNIKDAIKNIQKKNDSASVYKYNTIVMGIHNYYNRATNVFKDMKKIHYTMIPVLRNRLKRIGKYGYHMSKYYRFEERYFNKGSYKTWSVDNEPLIPICDVQYKTNVAFKKVKCNYTKEGRIALGYEKLFIDDVLKELNKNLSNTDNIQLYDNKISKYSMQKGKCEISKIMLNTENGEVHHTTPKEFGGSDSFRNIVWLHYSVHKLIHCSNMETIMKYIKSVMEESDIKLEIMIKKINKYRKVANMNPIKITDIK